MRAKTLLQQPGLEGSSAGFMDAKDENGLGLNMSRQGAVPHHATWNSWTFQESFDQSLCDHIRSSFRRRSGLEMLFDSVKKAPQYLGVGRIGSTTRAEAVRCSRSGEHPAHVALLLYLRGDRGSFKCT